MPSSQLVAECLLGIYGHLYTSRTGATPKTRKRRSPPPPQKGKSPTWDPQANEWPKIEKSSLISTVALKTNRRNARNTQNKIAFFFQWSKQNYCCTGNRLGRLGYSAWPISRRWTEQHWSGEHRGRRVPGAGRVLLLPTGGHRWVQGEHPSAHLAQHWDARSTRRESLGGRGG